MKTFQAILAGVLLALLLQPAQGQGRVLEQGHEAMPGMLSFPDTVPGELVIKICTACRSVRLTLVPQSRFLIGKQEVSRVEFTRYIAARPMAPLVVVQPKNESIVSRIVVSATAR